jgi:hypothetical protein
MTFEGVTKCAVPGCNEPCSELANLCEQHDSHSLYVAVSTPSTATTARRTPYPSVRRASARSSPWAGATDQPVRPGADIVGRQNYRSNCMSFDKIWIQTIGQDNDWLERHAADEAGRKNEFLAEAEMLYAQGH